MNEKAKNDFFSWMDGILKREFPEDTVAICFNLYEEQDNHWGVELVGTDEYDDLNLKNCSGMRLLQLALRTAN